ncbi:DNA mismatch repair MutS family like protein [Aduncisulcus paluster]|uniref:DNA mismatch repair MutS family like protein n=1 Tax=Aduncisulcus paluster TaxID=2918883 RepID=A0ABQ5JUQ3_9EUKA|nr:DNA mismatch repair MutS family like protein [Aduncisulcus paluster]
MLSFSSSSCARAIQKVCKTVGTLDVLTCCSKLIRLRKFSIPQIYDTSESALYENKLHLIQMRHPIAELSFSSYVPTDVSIVKHQPVIVLSGGNMSGKSCLMKSVALSAILCQCGFPIPCNSGSYLPMFDHIAVRAGAEDDILRGKSTFLCELEETQQALKFATSDSLVLLDELGRGTASLDAAAITTAVLNHVCTIGAVSFLSTHSSYVSDSVHEFEACQARHMGFVKDDEIVRFLYSFKKGKSPSSYGVNVAQMAGIGKDIIKVAQDIVSGIE